MKYLLKTQKVLTIIMFFLLIFSSCNNEEIFVVEESSIVEEETEETEEETPNAEDETVFIDAVDDIVNTMQNTPVDIEAYINDENLPVSITVSNTNPSNGTLVINNNGTPDILLDDTVVYTPNDDFFGEDSFEYTICDALDSNNCDIAKVLITVEENINNDYNEFLGETRAFPKAQGAGAYAYNNNVTYTVKEVTNLNDSGAGSFWSAIGDNTIVVFRVSGIIDWNQSFHDDARTVNNCIILGQTAPSPGITIVNNGAKFKNSSNLTFRYLRFRLWRGRSLLHDPSSSDVLEFLSCNNVIVDHCSFSFGGDETISTRNSSHTFTLQNSIISYGHSGSLMGDSDDYTLGYDYSILGNFWHTLGKRMPNPNGNGRFDMIGNAAYNLLNLGMRTGGDVQMNVIGNYYKNVPNHHLNLNQTPLVYNQNNIRERDLTANGQDNTILYQGRPGQRAILPTDFTSTMFPLLNYTEPLPDGSATLLRVQNREMGSNKVLDNNGNAITVLDDLDLKAYNQWDSNERFDWKDPSGLVTSNPENRTQSNHRVIPQRQWLPDNQANFGVVVNEHNQTTHTGVVPNSWIIQRGLNPDTFNPLGNDLHENYPNILIYSFQVDQ
ncbi:hypothetical protein DIS18_09025 [Algibacter marinivivus]|uniref:Pectate lyase n=1 Tax=Algibacter marinivivus TaxID=2100723 RepID=A0A2U2X3M5_9FLAO|nr:Ig-like domain-containing protein [Algibacter marinivivus]PWH82385.1 hypothetical protein DIS18_09025 [Algibacter marinivivus]